MSEKVAYLIDKENVVVCWQVRDNMKVEDAQKVSDEIKKAVREFGDKDIKVLVDNRYMIRNDRPLVFTADVNSVWEELQGYLLTRVSKVAVLCSSALMKLQMDRLAKATGLISKLKSFYNEDKTVSAKEAYDFLEIKGNKLVDSKF